MLMQAPIAVASPARKPSRGWCVANATAKIGASVDSEPSIKPVIAGCARWSRNDRWSRGLRARAMALAAVVPRAGLTGCGKCRCMPPMLPAGPRPVVIRRN